MAGDVESNPGPGRKRPAATPLPDVLVGDVETRAAKYYEKAVSGFEVWLRYRGLDIFSAMQGGGVTKVVALAVAYLRAVFVTQEIPSYTANCLVAGLRRFLLLCGAMGYP
eukprot:9273094-Lingulodinium_polyedra.AAC.1